jgi:hypothetical protein
MYSWTSKLHLQIQTMIIDPNLNTINQSFMYLITRCFSFKMIHFLFD